MLTSLKVEQIYNHIRTVSLKRQQRIKLTIRRLKELGILHITTTVATQKHAPITEIIETNQAH